jgi:hypothetical protein
MSVDDTDQSAEHSGLDQLYFIETFLRQRADHKTLLAVDELILRSDLAPTDRQAKLQSIIQGALDVKR